MVGAVVFRYRRPSSWAAGIRDDPSEFPGTSEAGGPTIAPRLAMSSVDAAAAQTAGSTSVVSRRTGRMRAGAVRPGDREARGISPARAAVRPNSSPRARGAWATVITKWTLRLPPRAVFTTRNPATAVSVASGAARHARPAPRARSSQHSARVHTPPAAAATQMYR